jgi:hypothetical protein
MNVYKIFHGLPTAAKAKIGASLERNLRLAIRYAQCRWTDSVLRTLALLLAALAYATPKQAKEPKVPNTHNEDF